MQQNTIATPREVEVLELICQGRTAKEIASSLFMSTHTVDSHRKNLIQKFDVRNSIHLAATVVRMGLV